MWLSSALGCVGCSTRTLHSDTCCSYCRSGLPRGVWFRIIIAQVVQVDEEELQATALKILFDFVMLYGLSSFKFSDPFAFIGRHDDVIVDRASGSEETILPVLTRYLDSEHTVLQTIAVEGFEKLLLLNRIASSQACHVVMRCDVMGLQIFSHLVILFFNPTTEDNVLLRQSLTVFFQIYNTTLDHLVHHR